MVSAHAVGDEVTYDKLGTYLFKQLRGPTKVLTTSDTPLEIVAERDDDREIVMMQERYSCGIYTPRKGAGIAKNN